MDEEAPNESVGGYPEPAADIPPTEPAMPSRPSRFRRGWAALARTVPHLGMPALVLLLVLAAYYIGSLRAEVSELKKDRGAAVLVPTSAAPARPAATPTPSLPPPVVASDNVRGSQSAKVFLVEYSDLECPYCRVHHATMQQLVADYGGQVAWVYRHLPLGFHANAQKEAEAAQCAGAVGGEDGFWRYVDAIMARTASNGTGFPLPGLVPLAAELGLDQGRFADCLNSGAQAATVKEQAAGAARAGITGTPSTFIVRADGSTIRLAVGALPIDDMRTAIDAVLNR